MRRKGLNRMGKKNEQKTPEEKKPTETPAEETPKEETPKAQKPAEEPKKEEKKEKKEKASEKKASGEKSYTVTKEQMDKMENLAAALAHEKDQYLRLAAEYDNYRKRTAREKESIYTDAKIDTIKEMLGVYDNLERGIAQYPDKDSPHRKGLEMIFKQFEEILTKLGVTKIEAKGEQFDPEKHNAVMHVEDETIGENTVVEVFQQGFMLGEKVLRFAIVKVAN